MRLTLGLASAVALASAPLAAQGTPRTPGAAAVRRAVRTITASDFRQGLAVVADDSMRGRDTPSPEVDETAKYIAAEFGRLGLRPAGDAGTFLQRYPVRRTQLDSTGVVVATGRGATGRWAIGREVALLDTDPLESLTVTGPAVLMVGAAVDTVRPFGDVDLRGAVILQALPAAARTQQEQLLIRTTISRAAAAGALAWIMLLDLPAQAIAATARGALRPRYGVPGLDGPLPLPVLALRDSDAADVLRAAGEELGAIRDTSVHTTRAVPGFTVSVNAPLRVLLETTAPNVIGVLEGSDPRLRDEYVTLSAHMDHVGVSADGRCTAAGADSICNGADDNGSGTIGLVQLARAFAALTPRPRRSLVFVAVSGEERGLWGSRWYVEHRVARLDRHVADLNLDAIGRNWPDSVEVVGKEHSTLGEVANRVTRDHPEVGMRLVDALSETNRRYAQSDHYSFARAGVPVLFFFSGPHPDLHRPTDEPDRVDAEKVARVLKMVFYVALDVANADHRPEWDPESRRRIVQGPGD